MIETNFSHFGGIKNADILLNILGTIYGKLLSKLKPKSMPLEYTTTSNWYTEKKERYVEQF